MIEALALAAGALDEPRLYLAAASKAADFILTQMRRDDGRLWHTWRAGSARVEAFLDDYAGFIGALVTLDEATFDERWIDEAVRLADVLLAHFLDGEAGGFFFTADDQQQQTPLARQKEWQDSSTPGGNALAATALVQLGKLTGRTEYLEAAHKTLEAAGGLMQRYPAAAAQMLCALGLELGPTPELVMLGDAESGEVRDVVAALRRRFIPDKVVAVSRPSWIQQN